MDVRPLDIAQDGNLFPREDLLEAVAESDWRDRSVPIAAWVLTSIGLAALAAGMPIARFVLMGPTEVAAAGDAPWLHPVHALAAAAGRAGLGIEAAFFLLSALAFGLSFAAIGLALRASGFTGRLAFVSALVAVASPLLCLHARLPSDAPFAVLAGAIVFAAIAAPSDPGKSGDRGYALRLTGALAVALVVHPSASVLFLPVAFAAGSRGPLWVAPAFVVTLVITRASGSDFMGTYAGADAIFGGWSDVLLAGSAAWLAVAMGWVREAEETPPPRWLAVWIGVVLALPLITSRSSTAALAALPAIAVFVGDALARRARPDGALRWAATLLVAQVTVTLAVASFLPTNTESFAATGAGETREGDRVWSDDLGTTTTYLLQRRLGLDVRLYDPEDASRATPPVGRDLDLGRPLGHGFVLDPASGEVTPIE